MTLYFATAIELNLEGRACCQVQRGEGALPDQDHAVVDGLYPGESARVRLGRRRRGTREGRVEGPIQDSTRLAPACAHSHQCGGCRTQQLPYADELAWKQRNLQRLFPNMEMAPICGSPKRFAYRNKMEWTFAQDRQGKRFLGLHGRAVRGVIDIHQCALVNPWMNQMLDAVRRWWSESGLPAYSPHKNIGLLRTLTLREGFRTGDRLASLLIHGDEQEQLAPHLPGLIETMKPLCHHLVVRIQIAQAGRPTRFEEQVLLGTGRLCDELVVNGETLRIEVSPSAFLQPNPWVAERLYGAVLDQIDPQQPVVDLFAGTATLGLLAALKGARSVSVEINRDACENALRNQELNGLANRHQVVCADALDWCAQHSEAIPQLIVDPPRAGLGSTICQWLIEHRPQRILYISCNPKTQKQDIGQLVEGGYQVKCLRPFDQFPNTPHVEQLAILERSG